MLFINNDIYLSIRWTGKNNKYYICSNVGLPYKIVWNILVCVPVLPISCAFV